MTLSSTLSPADRFSLIIGSMIQSVLGRGFLLGPLVGMICGRLVRMGLRFRSLEDRARDGKVTPRRVRAARLDTTRAAPAPVGPKLPRGFAWLLPLVPGAANFGGQLLHLLGDPETAALVAASPGLQRLLRPMCRMLGVPALPEMLKPPPPVRRAATLARLAAEASAPPARAARPARPPRSWRPEGPSGGVYGVRPQSAWVSPVSDAQTSDAKNIEVDAWDVPRARGGGGFSSA